jgi:hypothetical protein
MHWMLWALLAWAMVSVLPVLGLLALLVRDNRARKKQDHDAEPAECGA